MKKPIQSILWNSVEKSTPQELTIYPMKELHTEVFNNKTQIGSEAKNPVSIRPLNLHLLWPRTIPINPIYSVDAMCCLVLRVSPLQDNDPCVSLQKHSNTTQSCNNANVGMLPVIVTIPNGILQCIEPFKDVDDTDDYGGVSNGVVVNIPVESVFVIFVGPQKQSKNLHRGRARERTIIPKVDQIGGTGWKSEGSIDGDLTTLTDIEEVYALGAPPDCETATRACAPTIAELSPRNPPVCCSDSSVSVCHVQLPSGLVVGPVE
ncbi:hypothetical protein CR513_13842, partial [Mucuna pruriens]